MPRKSASLLIIATTLSVAQTSVVQEAKLTASDGGPDDCFACSVALSGNTALIGASRNDGNRGAAYVFVRIGSTWIQQAKLLAWDGVTGEGFGGSVALKGGTALIGSAGDDGNRGAAYVFVRSGTTWTLQAKLRSFTSAGYFFGGSVALSGDTALIADNSFDDLRGAAYVFVRSGTIWRLQARLVIEGGMDFDLFGSSVALLGDVALIGRGQGGAWAFVRNGSTWTYANCCTAPEPVGFFGISLALIPHAGIFGAVGAAYLLPRGASEYIKLVPSDGDNGSFGLTVALSGDSALVGAPSTTAYVYRAIP